MNLYKVKVWNEGVRLGYYESSYMVASSYDAVEGKFPTARKIKLVENDIEIEKQ